ncbi:signal peptidase II [Helicobacter sp. 13S00477-4]|uniref:signal peptidase II n=1 Tax=Helicobacter sp. 13S00477-4 TaxID=1905759 RepID=UPI000BA61CF5|nr:signal peptidase II [Helicobacter sp. 13S00477-4]PAF52138.1 signal peptidase II [Helicobacter sp. 13S00477-4]
MKKSFLFFLIVFILIFSIDQYIKHLILEGLRWEGNFFSIILVFNKGVAFSMLSFLGDGLKYLQLILVILVWFLLMRQRDFWLRNYYILGMIFSAGCSNIFDRFVYGGVVDYIYWHYGFDFAVFNFADMMIDIGVGALILKTFLSKTK